jgi:hypothetical protein
MCLCVFSRYSMTQKANSQSDLTIVIHLHTGNARSVRVKVRSYAVRRGHTLQHVDRTRNVNFVLKIADLGKIMMLPLTSAKWSRVDERTQINTIFFDFKPFLSRVYIDLPGRASS